MQSVQPQSQPSSQQSFTMSQPSSQQAALAASAYRQFADSGARLANDNPPQIYSVSLPFPFPAWPLSQPRERSSLR